MPLRCKNTLIFLFFAFALRFCHLFVHLASAQPAKLEFGGFHILCNNAGVHLEKPFDFPHHISSGGWRKIVEVNLNAVIEGTQLACTEMKRTGGVIINTASLGGLYPMPDSPIYAATKAAVVHFTRSLKHLHQQQNIRVNAIWYILALLGSIPLI